MKKRLIIILLSFVALYNHAQMPDAFPRNLTKVLIELQQKSGMKYYFLPHETDSVMISPASEAINHEALIILLSDKGFKISTFNNAFFILKEVQIETELAGLNKPEELVDEPNQNEQPRGKVQVAGSEYKVYEIGRTENADSREFILRGKIKHFKTGDPVAGATIRVPKINAGAVTDQQGRYSINLPAGHHELEISGIGVLNTRRQIRMLSSGNLDIETEEEVFEIREMTVLSSRLNKTRESTMGTERFKVKEIKNIPMAFGETDLMKAVLALPGVKSTGEVSDGFNVRGSSSDQNLILLNHSTIFNSTHLFGMLSVFNPDVVDEMELYMSYIPSRYGGRIASVLDVGSKTAVPAKIGGSASLGVHTSRLMLQGPLGNGKTSFIAGARASYADWMLKLIPEKSSYLNGSAGFYDYNASIRHQFNEQNALTLHHYFSRDNFRFSNDELFAYQNMNFSAEWKQQISPLLIGKYIAGHDRFNNSIINIENEFSAYRLSTAIRQSFAKADFDWYPQPDHTVGFGMSLQHTQLHRGKLEPYEANSLVTGSELQKDNSAELAIYISDQWNVTPELAVNAGIRYSFYQFLGPYSHYLYNEEFLPSLSSITDTIEAGKIFLKNYHGPEFRLSARYLIGDDWSVKLGFNTMRQYIHKISNATVMSPTDTWKMSDMHLKPQTGIQFAGGVFRNFLNNSLITSVELYYKTTGNYPDYRSGANLVMNGHIETELVNTEARAYGVEVSVRKPTGKLTGWINYTYARSLLRQSDERIPNPVNKGDWYPADFDKPHDFKLVGNYKFTHRYSFSTNVFYSTGRPMTIPIARYRFAGGEYVYYSERNRYRIPDYFRMDASFNIEPSHHLVRLTHSTISFGLYNITGRKNVYSVFFKSENGSIKGKQLSILGSAIPYIAYNIKF